MDGKNEQLAAIRARREAVTPGVWYAERVEFKDTYAMAIETKDTRLMTLYPPNENREANAAFIAAAPTDIDTLLAEVERLTDERDALAQQLQQAQDAAKRLEDGLIQHLQQELGIEQAATTPSA